MAYSDLCHQENAYKSVENETDQSERIMEENSIVRDLISKILDESGPTEGSSSIQPPEKVTSIQTNNSQYPKTDTGMFIPPYNYQNSPHYNFSQDQNGFNFNNMPNSFGSNGYVNYSDNEVNNLLSMDLTDTSGTDVTPEQLNLLRLAAQEIGGAQFSSPNKYDDKFFNFYDPNQRNSMPENMFAPNNFTRPNSLNLDMNFNSNFEPLNGQRFPNNFKEPRQDPTELLAYLTQLNMSLDRNRDDGMNNMEFKMPLEMNGPYQTEEFNKMQDERNKMIFSRNFQNQPMNKGFAENHFYDAMSQIDRSPINTMNFDYSNQSTPPNNLNYKPNGFQHQNEFMQRRDMPMMPRDGFQVNGNVDQRFGDGVQQNNLRQNQELARQMSIALMRSRPPPNQLNVDVSFLPENNPFNMAGLGGMIGPSPPAPPPVLPSPIVDMPLLAPFYAMRNMRGAASPSSILHARLDACYEQWRQLERERKRTEARLALAYPGRAVSSSNSIPVPRLPPCPTRADRLTVDMLREHTKVLTLMGKMETLRASVCVAQNKKPNKPEDGKITVLKRGQENLSDKEKEKENGTDPTGFDPATWKEEVKNLAEIAPHSEVESAMLAWRNAVNGVQAARRREMTPHTAHARYNARHDPILQLAEAVKHLCACARRARCAMWCDLTLTVALADQPALHDTQADSGQAAALSPGSRPAEANVAVAAGQSNAKATPNDAIEEKPPKDITTKSEKPETKPNPANKQADKQEKNQQRRPQNYRKLNQGRNDFYQKNQRYDNRFMHNRHPYHYLATGPIN